MGGEFHAVQLVGFTETALGETEMALCETKARLDSNVEAL